MAAIISCTDGISGDAPKAGAPLGGLASRIPLALCRFFLLLLCLAWSAGAPAPAHAQADKDWWQDVINDRSDGVRRALARGADPNRADGEGLPALMLAVREGSWAVFDVLLASRRTDPNAVNRHQETPLMYVALVGDVARAQALVRRGAQVNRLGWTPLQYAASKGQRDVARMLLAHEAIVNAPGPNGETALMMAALAGSEPVARLLLDAGADATMRDLNGNDAAAWARRGGYDALAVKLDDLSQRVLVRRQALREGKDPDAVQAPLQRPAQEAPASGSAGMYFDLDRFKDDDAQGVSMP